MIYKAIEKAHPLASFDMRKAIYLNWMKYIKILTDFNESFGAVGFNETRKTLRFVTITHILTKEELMKKLYTEMNNVIREVCDMCDVECISNIFTCDIPKKADGNIDFNPDLWSKIFESKGHIVINNG